jgi:hypothetical protein
VKVFRSLWKGGAYSFEPENTGERQSSRFIRVLSPRPAQSTPPVSGRAVQYILMILYIVEYEIIVLNLLLSTIARYLLFRFLSAAAQLFQTGNASG